MADSHEEQLLNDLLGGIARDDARLDAAHLESQVLAAAKAPSVGLKPKATYIVIAAAIAVVVFAPAFLWMNRDVAPPTGGSKVASTEEVIAHQPDTVVPKRPAPSRAVDPVRSVRTQPARPTNPTRPAAEAPVAQLPVVLSAEEFVPLMPITAQELTGSFQIVRVQMPRASLGALRSPLEQPHELVEADVLLGEDGMARGIRLSTSGSVYPWRTR